MKRLMTIAAVAASFCAFAAPDMIMPTPLQKTLVKQAVAEAQTYTDTSVSNVTADVSEVKTIAESAKTTAELAVTTANESKTTADSAKTTAEAANTTATSAKTLATTANTAATNAGTAAAEAKTLATTANTAAEEAKTVASEASSTVTNSNELLLKMAPCTSFKVYVNNTVDPAGTEIAGVGTPVTDLPAGMVEEFNVRSPVSQANMDVFVDWGDGSDFSYAKDVVPTSHGVDDNYYAMSHTYATPGIYRVKIYGKTYATIRSSLTAMKTRVCSFGGLEDEISVTADNMASFCNGSACLMNMTINGWRTFSMRNMSYTFANCTNLRSITNFCQFDTCRSSGGMFDGCVNMTNCDYRLSHNLSNPTSIINTFKNCKSLAVDINKLLPNGKFSARTIDVSNLFYNCAKLTGTVPADILWGDTNVTWKNTANCFTGCSDAIRAQVPVSWGGTKAE